MATHAALSPLPDLPANSAAPQRSRALVLLTAVCGVFVSFASIVVYTFGVFLKPLSASFGWSRTQLSLAFSLAALAVAIGSPFIGRLLDRYPVRRIVLTCTAVYGLAFGSLALLTPRLSHLFAVFILIGAVGNGTTQLAYARVVSAWFDRSRGRALAAVMAGSAVGSIVFPPLAQFVISSYGWRTAYATLGVIILLGGLPLPALFLYEPPRAPKLPITHRGHSRDPILPSILSFPFLALVAALLLFSFATNGLNAHWAALLTDRGFRPQQAAAVLSLAGFAALAGKLSAGYLLDRFLAGRVVALLFIASALGFVGILFARVGHGASGSIAWLSAVLIGVGMGAESDAVPYLLTRYFGLARFGELYGYTWFVYALAGALGPLAMGRAYDRAGSYHAGLLACVGLVLAAAVLFALLPKYKPATT